MDIPYIYHILVFDFSISAAANNDPRTGTPYKFSGAERRGVVLRKQASGLFTPAARRRAVYFIYRGSRRAGDVFGTLTLFQ